MKVVNENLELVDVVDYKDTSKEKEEKKEEKENLTPYKLMIKLQLIDLVYDMNKDLHHKMNVSIIGFQMVILIINLLLPRAFNISTIPVAIAAAVIEISMLYLVVIGNILSEKAIRTSRKHQQVINKCVEKMSKGIEGTDEYTK